MMLEFNYSRVTTELSKAIPQLADQYKSEMMDASELTYLGASIQLVQWQEGDFILEVGTYHGRTAVFMAKVAQVLGKKVPVLSIDAFERIKPDSLNPSGSYTNYMANVTLAGVDRQCMPLVAFSDQAACVVRDQIGVLVVDGWHEYPTVKKDLELYPPKVKPGGIIFLDDYGEAYPGVIRAADEFFDQHREYTILHKSYFVIAQKSEQGSPIVAPYGVDAFSATEMAELHWLAGISYRLRKSRWYPLLRKLTRPLLP